MNLRGQQQTERASTSRHISLRLNYLHCSFPSYISCSSFPNLDVEMHHWPLASLFPSFIITTHSEGGDLLPRISRQTADLSVWCGCRTNWAISKGWLSSSASRWRYKVVHKLGWGGYSTVWLARDLKYVLALDAYDSLLTFVVGIRLKIYVALKSTFLKMVNREGSSKCRV